MGEHFKLHSISYHTINCIHGIDSRDGRAGLFCHRAGLERAGLIFVQPGWAGAGWVGLASTHKNRAAGFFPSIN